MISDRDKQNLRMRQHQPGVALQEDDSPLAIVQAYHQRTKHRTDGYALGPASLDWDAQPSPYRFFSASPAISLPFSTPHCSYADLFSGKIKPVPLSLTSLAQLFEYALSLAAIKIFGPDSWTVRCNPSSGNLHPTEAYLICADCDGLEAGIYHYRSDQHQLEQRAKLGILPAGSVYLALSSVHWREAWKYGERAYRYCQLDVGHAIATLRYSAALLGWQLHLETQFSDVFLSQLCGLNRHEDFSGVEPENADLLIRIDQGQSSSPLDEKTLPNTLATAPWQGKANLLDPMPLYHWQIIDQVNKACCKQTTQASKAQPTVNIKAPTIATPAATLIKQRRSALAFQPDKIMERQHFLAILAALLVEQRSLPLDLFGHQPKLHPVLFIHRVEGLAPGLYCLPRSDSAKRTLQQAMQNEFLWQAMDESLPLYLLQQGDARRLSKQISYHQAIASDSAFSLGMLAEFAKTLCDDANSWRYRELHWEAGMLGQILYLEAEAYGYRGTGIGCFFDDLFHELLGLQDQQFQSLYHFTVGIPVLDQRITTLQPYSSKE